MTYTTYRDACSGESARAKWPLSALVARRLLDYSPTWRRYVISREARDWSVRGARSELRYVRICECISIGHNGYWPVENKVLSLVNRAGHPKHRSI